LHLLKVTEQSKSAVNKLCNFRIL